MEGKKRGGGGCAKVRREKKRELYHSVLLVRGDGEELWWVRHRRVLHRLSGGLDRPEGLRQHQTTRRREEEKGFSQRRGGGKKEKGSQRWKQHKHLEMKEGGTSPCGGVLVQWLSKRMK